MIEGGEMGPVNEGDRMERVQVKQGDRKRLLVGWWCCHGSRR